ncbi:hypothetical protein A1O7_01357 [Cladophialophora yegresii CBS 114405]|uniref:Arf-GAP domain-containing protein n=1 Tax=Cladophialophora yegresii CBS 114405 TaxID=1182544 RepID=W9WAQ7_9EURO|nr:uncharacterized protein A1O7_01357 [Cladophialophora yegresii CBS 114405]EXJ65018.1 hypothetical protein A1O7_01357 [Cladophialophora yegresii CBS 114405]
MASSMSKRTQARNEKELHQLLSVAGNSQCADCGAKNPAWASWNLGIFLCMRCASLHRKLGTHISKVKSLSMDTWTSEQVESMKLNGNNAVNKAYNPKNKKPDMPLDADEVDSAMERFIRKKYQEKSLADGKPQPPQRDEYSPTAYSPRPPLEDPNSPPPPVPTKKGKIFGFGLRASSSAYPFSKSDKKKKAQEPRVDSAFTIPTRGFDSRMDDAHYEMTDAELEKKLATLRDMGFTETERNASLLRRLNGNVERVVETLVRLGPRENGDTTSRQNTRSAPAQAHPSTSRAPEPSYNPFTQSASQPTVGLSLGKPQEPSTPTSATTFGSNNPFAAPPDRTTTGLEQSFQSMQVSQQPQQALFPHSTGGYPSQPAPIQDPRSQYSMTPPVPSTQYQDFVASPPTLPMPSNPFFQPTSLSAQSTGNNPFLPQSQVPMSPPTNPFLSQGFIQPPQPPQRQVSLPASFNPFGIPPAQTSPGHQQQFQPQDPFATTSQQTIQQQNDSFPTQAAQQQAQPAGYQTAQSQFAFPNTQYVQAQPQAPAQQQAHAQTPQFLQQHQPSYQQQSEQQFPQQAQQPFQPFQHMPQQNSRQDKNSILALYNYPQLTSQRLASIPEPATDQHQQQQPQQQQSQQQQQQYQQQFPPMPSDPFGNLPSPKRSVTMPVSLSNMHSAGGSGNRNPFMTNTNATTQNTNATTNPFGGGTSPFASPPPQPGPQAQSQPSPFGQVQPQPQTQQPQPQYAHSQSQSNPFGRVKEIGHGFVTGGGFPGSMTNYSQGPILSTQQRPAQGIAPRHASSESMAVNNLDAGRHSPDAFASLSARYG